MTQFSHAHLCSHRALVTLLATASAPLFAPPTRLFRLSIRVIKCMLIRACVRARISVVDAIERRNIKVMNVVNRKIYIF